MSTSEDTAVKIGPWILPSGNSCEAVLRLHRGAFVAELIWDEPPPLSEEDEAFYLAVIRPEVVRRVLEISGGPYVPR